MRWLVALAVGIAVLVWARLVRGAEMPATTPESRIATAKSFLGKGIRYGMGADRAPPDPDPAMDCSAFAWRTMGQRKKGYWNTDGIVNDALGPQKRFRPIPAAVPGCFAVYGRRWNNGHVGHIALVVDPDTRTIIDSSSSRNGVAMHVDDKAKFWDRHVKGRAIFVVPVGG